MPGIIVEQNGSSERHADPRSRAGSRQLPPEFSIEACDAHDAWIHGAALSQWEHDYEQVRPGRFSGRVHTAWLGPMQLIHERIDHGFKYRGTAWRGSRVFFSYLPSSADIFYDDRPVSASALVTHRWSGVERVNSSNRIDLVLVAIDEDFLTQSLAPLPGIAELLRTPFPVCHTSGGDAITTFQHSVQGTLEELLRSPALLESERTRKALQQRVLDSIVAVLSDAAAPGGRLPAPCTRSYIVGRAIDYLEAHLADPISVRNVCAAIRVCPRTLSYAFCEALGTSPKAYLLAARLNRAYRELADARVNASIESIAMRWGFSHMGRFAQYYREAFGERPSDTYRERSSRGAAGAGPRLLAAARARTRYAANA